MSAPRGSARRLAVLLVLLVAVGGFPSAADAASTSTDDCRYIPDGAAAVWTGTRILIFGGRDFVDGHVSTIRSHDPAVRCAPFVNRQVPAAVGSTLPLAIQGATAAWTGTHAFVFGGENSTHYQRTEIHRFDPVEDELTTMSVALPRPLARATAVWDGAEIWIFGGYSYVWEPSFPGGSPAWQLRESRDVFAYAPATNTLRSWTNAAPMAGPVGAAWNGTALHVFGTVNWGTTSADPGVWLFDRSTATFADLGVDPPRPLRDPAVVWDAGRYWLLGGRASNGCCATLESDRIYAFDPVTATFATSPSTLHRGGASPVAVMAGSDAYVLHGDPNGRSLERFRPWGGDLYFLQSLSVADGAGIVWDGQFVLFLGGRTGTGAGLAEIKQWNPANGQLATRTTQLLQGHSDFDAVWTGSQAVLLGMRPPGAFGTKGIHIYSPANGTVWDTGAQLPTNRTDTVSFWDGRDLPAIGCAGGCAYVLGGLERPAFGQLRTHDDIVRYNPRTNTVTTLAQSLPTPRHSMGLAFDGTHAFLVGGAWNHDIDGEPGVDRKFSEVLRLDPVTASTTVLTSLPAPRVDPFVVWDGVAVMVYGGYGESDPNSLETSKDTVYRFVPGGVVLQLPETLPTRTASGQAIFTGDGVYLFGDYLRAGAYFHDHAPANLRPVWELLPGGTVVEDNVITRTVRARDPEGAPLTLRAMTLPRGATFLDHRDGNGTFSWRPDFNASGSHVATFVASDGSKGRLGSISLTVLNNDRLPGFHPLPQIVAFENEPVSADIRAGDPDGEAVTLSATNLPAGASFTHLADGHGRFAWVPAVGDAGARGFTAIATANGASTSVPVPVTVHKNASLRLAVNGAPSLATSPGATVTLSAVLTNLGVHDDHVSFSLSLAGTPVAPPDPVLLAPGASTTVTFDVVVQQAGQVQDVVLRAQSGNTELRSASASWRLVVPVVIVLTLDPVEPGRPVTGTVVVTFRDGSPATGYDVQAETYAPGLLNALPHGRASARTDEDGRTTFSFGLDPTTWTPGDHVVIVGVSGEGRTGVAVRTYRV